MRGKNGAGARREPLAFSIRKDTERFVTFHKRVGTKRKGATRSWRATTRSEASTHRRTERLDSFRKQAGLTF